MISMNSCYIYIYLSLPQDHVLQQTTPVVVDLLEVVGVICFATQLETAVLILPRPASHVSVQTLGTHYQSCESCIHI